MCVSLCVCSCRRVYTETRQQRLSTTTAAITAHATRLALYRSRLAHGVALAQWRNSGDLNGSRAQRQLWTTRCGWSNISRHHTTLVSSINGAGSSWDCPWLLAPRESERASDLCGKPHKHTATPKTPPAGSLRSCAMDNHRQRTESAGERMG